MASSVEVSQPSIGNVQFTSKRWSGLLLPSLSDCLFLAVLVWLFATGSGGWYGLLADADTGWHIRTGEWILDNGRVPQADLFSFSKAGQPWFAWEWLTDVGYGALHRVSGMKGLLLLSAVVIAGYGTLLFRHMIWLGSMPFVALLVALLGFGASTIHYLARPHIFTLLGLTISLWIVDADRRRNSWRVWLLVPVSAVWVNVHGGFLSLLACLGILAAGSYFEAVTGHGGWASADLSRAKRYTLLAASCSAASLLNPYGWELHRHIFAYLQSDWIKNNVREFQSPSFRTESAFQFELLLFLGLMSATWMIWKREYVTAGWIVFWGHNALSSERHIPVFMIVAGPPVALLLTELWRLGTETRGRKSVLGILASLATDMRAGCSRSSVWIAVVTLLFTILPASIMKWPTDFPDIKFPARMANKYESMLVASRVLTRDQWADYLIYRYYPRHKVFMDGRSDFYGEKLGRQYLALAQGNHNWETLLDEYKFDAILAPVDWNLVSLLKRDTRWRVVDDDGLAILFQRIRPSESSGPVPPDQRPAATGEKSPARF
jgi:hypothetical protein